MNFQKLLKNFLVWRLKHVSNQRFIIVLSIIVGLSVGFFAVIIKNSVHLIQSFITGDFAGKYQGYMYFIYPGIGILLTIFFIKFIVRKSVEPGIPATLYAISKKNGLIKQHNMYSSIITSALTVGFGGSVGLEGPTIATGTALSSNIGRLLHLNYKQITLLLGCAASGAMAAIFKAPIAAIVFAIEVIMLDLTLSSIVPLLIASASAVLTSYFFLGNDVLYSFKIIAPFKLENIHYYLIMGVITALVSVYFARMHVWMGKLFDKFKHQIVRFTIGSLILGVLLFFFPALYGEGYHEINSGLSGNYSYLFENIFFSSFKGNIYAFLIATLLLTILKVIAASATSGAGGVGGIFAPTLFMGANIGIFYAIAINHFNLGSIEVSNFALIGMCGLIAGVLHAPLTSIFLIAEITGGYELFLPLMITATISYMIVRYFEPNSVYTIQLAKNKELITHDKDKAILSMMKVDSLIERNFNTIHVDATLGDLVKVVSQSRRNIFPVVDNQNNYYGIITLDYIREIMFDTEKYENTYVRNLLFMPNIAVAPDELMEEVAYKFQMNHHYNMPVVENGKYIGFVSRANVFSTYRRMLKRITGDL